MEKKKKRHYSLANQAGIIILLFLLIIIALFSLERYYLEKERVLHTRKMQVEMSLAEKQQGLMEIAETINELGDKNNLDFHEKVSSAQKSAQPLVNHLNSHLQSGAFGYYSHTLGTFVAISPQEKFHNLVGNSLNLPQDNNLAAQRLKKEVDGFPLFSCSINCQRGISHGQIWAIIPPEKLQKELINRLRGPLLISLIAIFLSLSLSFYISRKIRKATGFFQHNMEAFAEDPGGHRLENTSLPREFLPLFRQYSHMVQRIQELMGELSISARTLVLGNLVGVITHDVRNPLSIVLNSAKMALNSENIEKKDLNLQRIIKASREINLILEKSLSLVRIPGEEKEKINLNTLIQDIRQVADPLLLKKNIKLQFISSEDLPPLLGNSLALRQALMNIIQNSITATPEGGKITIKARRTQNKGILLSISDNGKGIPLEIKDKIFERFFTTRGEKGTGLGLALAKAVVENHQGKIWAHSLPGKGATINIYFPDSGQC